MNFSQNKSQIHISERLKTCASFVPKNALVCDVGSDHALLPAFLLKQQTVQKIIISDVNSLPLSRGKKNISKYGLSDQCEFVLSDGIKDLLFFHPDGFVIAGMSGETIINILDIPEKDSLSGKFFILQPMTRDYLLRKFLSKTGFEIKSEKCVYENEKTFLIIYCVYTGIPADISESVAYIGLFTDTFEKCAKDKYLCDKINSLEIKIAGLEKAGLPSDNEKILLQYAERRK